MTSKFAIFDPGCRVRLKKDPRHTGVVLDPGFWTAFPLTAALCDVVRVRWDETNWLSDEAVDGLEAVPVEPMYGPGMDRMMARMGGETAEALRQKVLEDQAKAQVDVLSDPPQPPRDRQTYRDYPAPRHSKQDEPAPGQLGDKVNVIKRRRLTNG